ncbi:MAG: Asp-tRNA(Asn)/Glu-tRNA(Gln) amidotransferase subunit GatC [Culicoidibacterales bacterium]
MTKEELLTIANNAKIEILPEQEQYFLDKINESIEMVSIIAEIDLTNVEPMFYPNQQQYNFRDDTLVLKTDKEAMLANTQASEDGQFKFPRVLKGAKSNE